MKMSTDSKIKNGVLLLTLCLILGVGQHLYAQNPLEDIFFPDDVEDEPPAPIDGFIGIALAVGAYFGARNLRKKGE